MYWFDPEINPVANQAQILAFASDYRKVFYLPLEEGVEVIKKLPEVEKFFQLAKQQVLEYPFARGIRPELKKEFQVLILSTTSKEPELSGEIFNTIASKFNLNLEERGRLRDFAFDLNDRLLLINQALGNIENLQNEMKAYFLACDKFIEQGKTKRDLEEELAKIKERRKEFTEKSLKAPRELEESEIKMLQEIEIFPPLLKTFYKTLSIDALLGMLKKVQIAALIKLSELEKS